MRITQKEYVDFLCNYLKSLFEKKNGIEKAIEDMTIIINEHTENSAYYNLEYFYNEKTRVCYYMKRKDVSSGT